MGIMDCLKSIKVDDLKGIKDEDRGAKKEWTIATVVIYLVPTVLSLYVVLFMHVYVWGAVAFFSFFSGLFVGEMIYWRLFGFRNIFVDSILDFALWLIVYGSYAYVAFFIFDVSLLTDVIFTFIINASVFPAIGFLFRRERVKGIGTVKKIG